jgi:hypothetical protein
VVAEGSQVVVVAVLWWRNELCEKGPIMFRSRPASLRTTPLLGEILLRVWLQTVTGVSSVAFYFVITFGNVDLKS